MTLSEQITLGILVLFAVVFMTLALFFSYQVGKEVKRLDKKYGGIDEHRNYNN